MHDVVLRGGRVATTRGDDIADIAIVGERIVAIGSGLGPGREEIDCHGCILTPGGIDSHCHIEQLSVAGLMTADDFESATRSAALGGTTTVIPFAAQHRGMRLRDVVEDYRRRAARGALVDFALHMIVSDPTEETLASDLPALIGEGFASIKVFMAYDRLGVGDEQLLDILAAARAGGAMVCVHAENHGLINWMTRRLVDGGHRAARNHATSHPRAAEIEAVGRLILWAELLDQPVVIFHVSTREAVGLIAAARRRGVKLFAETCPHYLLLTEDEMDRPGGEGGKFICSPPLRTAGDQAALWEGLASGVLDLVSSDHSPYAFDATGKLRAGPDPAFQQVPNGMPGIGIRMPLMFDAMVGQGRSGLRRFVELTATAPARIYNLLPRKGDLEDGADADIVVWDPGMHVVQDDATCRDRAGYSPYRGREIAGWPRHVLRRGTVIVDRGEVRAAPGSGRLLLREGGEAARPASVPFNANGGLHHEF